MITCDLNRSFEEHLSSLEEIDDNLRFTRRKLVRDLINRLQDREREWDTSFQEILNRSQEIQSTNDINNTIQSLNTITSPPILNKTLDLSAKLLSSETINSSSKPKQPSEKLDSTLPSSLGTTKSELNKDGILRDTSNSKPNPQTANPKSDLLKSWRKANKEFNDPSFSNYFAIREYIRIQEILVQAREQFNNFQQSDDQNIKKYRNELMAFIKLQINSMSGTDKNHLETKVRNLADLFNGLRVRNHTLDVNGHPLAKPFCIDFAAQACVKAAVRCNTNVVTNLGFAINALEARVPGFRDLVIGHVQERYPFTIPINPDPNDFPPDSNQEELYKIACGYQMDTKTQSIEADQTYLERLRYTVLFYASVLNAGPINLCWSWLASFLSLYPEPVITATVLEAFLSIVSQKMSSSFGPNYEKILSFISSKYVAMIEQVTSDDVQSLVKLKNLLSEESKRKHSTMTMNSIFGSSMMQN